MVATTIVFFTSVAFVTSSNFNQRLCSTCQPTPLSCSDIKKYWPTNTSKYYNFLAKGETKFINCHNVEELCGSGGWTRLAYLNMSNSLEHCPSGFKLFQADGVRACGRATSSVGSCTSVQFPSNGTSYSQVCGRVVGYQYASTDGNYPGNYNFEDYGSIIDPSHNDINSYYVDGVSITRGSPRQHVWTLIAGLHQSSKDANSNDYRFNCPCSPNSPQNSTLQSFIGNDYFCESGSPTTDGSAHTTLYTHDPLWDGKGCGIEGACCTAPGLPWFHKVLSTTTTDYLELRVCGDEGSGNEDSPVSFYELYVK